ncbi:Integrase catalytic core [Trinorchestia longiramus]|nr:Integrase catalytic core [Trinorchestia longiramus]
MKLENGQNLQDHLKVFVELLEELAIIGDAIVEEQRVIILLSSLPDRVGGSVKGSEVINQSVAAKKIRKKEDFSHINVAELEAVLKGVKLALKWGMTSIELRIDSATVAAWLQSVVSTEKRVHTKGAAEILIKRRLGNLREMMIEFGLKIQISLVPTDKNKADVLTRVKKRWLCGLEVGGNDIDEHEQVRSSAYMNIIEVHNKHHVGVGRTLYLARKMDPNVSREDVKRVVRSCERCQSIDPAPLKHEPGEVSVKTNWSRLAIDVTHYRGRPYLSMVDCGPGRFAVWRELRRENMQCIVTELTNIFLESGPVDELLMDNSTVFRSQMLADMLREWNVERVFRAAYRPAGNGIVERHHRTEKGIAERGRISPIEAVYWYNSTPRSGQDELSMPQRSVCKYEWREGVIRREREREGERERVREGESERGREGESERGRERERERESERGRGEEGEKEMENT